MIYTVQPIDTVMYGGAIAMSILMSLAVFLYFCLSMTETKNAMNTLKSTDFKVVTAVLFAIVAITWFVSAVLMDNTPALNQPVVATKVTTTTHAIKTGKYGIREGAYVVYQVPEGEVGFSAGSGLVWADQVILYKQR